ncbi:hypothetical protein C8K30_1011016 [Promicromonospora sp. AC04]|uniref:hypothetical protein n=1 Tax=Promicromonospora sp. AC04 TaxID=2135723 RepID=UPI000D39EF8E|nr:hypothetical protein [Promicromonospora sp. AC04]PUB32490.1 hypothetical protein C8K30_1011016 [Promicromonospora sp. AC04]
MAQRKDLGTGPAGRSRASRALPVSSDGTVHLDHAQAADDPVRGAEPDAGEPVDTDDSQPWHEKLRDSVRGFFGATARERMSDRDEVHRIDVERAQDEREGMDEREQLLKLRAETRLAGEAYMASLRASNLLVPGFNDDERDKELDVMHHVYMQMMMQSCLKPLARGVSTGTVVQAAGMMVAMRMLAPDFRQEMDTYLQPFKDMVQERIDRRTRYVGDWAEGQSRSYNRRIDDRARALVRERPSAAAAARSVHGQEGHKASRSSFLSRRWQRRLDDLERRERGNRELYTPDSAAMTEVALMENAFWRMREPDADAGQIFDSYRAMRKRLRDQMDHDGVERSEMVTRARMIIGERMEYEPELRTMFNGIAHGRIVKAAPRQERIGGTDHVRAVWSGQFEDQLGQRLPDDGMFTLRRPMDATSHQVQLAETMTTALLHALDREDQEAFAANVQGYMVGFAARRHGLNTRGLPGTLGDRLDQCEVMIASMAIDGLTPEEQQRVYSNAYVDAMEAAGEKHPDLAHELRLALGDGWQQTLQRAVDDPQAFYEEQRLRPRPYRAGPGPSSEQADDFDPETPDQRPGTAGYQHS